MQKQIKRAWMFVVLMALVLVGINHAQEIRTRTHTAPDLASFTYPLDWYSVRSYISGIPSDQSDRILFPGVVVIDPNDSLIYGEEPGSVYRIRLLSVARDDEVTEDNLSDLFGTLPLAQYTPDMMGRSKPIKFKLGDLPAVRLNDVPVGQAGLTAHILVLGETQVYEIIVEPVVQGGGTQEVEAARKKLFEDILRSIEWVSYE